MDSQKFPCILLHFSGSLQLGWPCDELWPMTYEWQWHVLAEWPWNHKVTCRATGGKQQHLESLKEVSGPTCWLLFAGCEVLTVSLSSASTPIWRQQKKSSVTDVIAHASSFMHLNTSSLIKQVHATTKMVAYKFVTKCVCVFPARLILFNPTSMFSLSM